MVDDRRVVVIGSGPAGAMAAHQLLERDVPVTMLESGTARPSGVLVRAAGRNLFRRVPPIAAPPKDYVAVDDPATTWACGLQPGGLSNQWTGAVPRFAPEDFTEGERLHERYRWPLDYDDLVPYYESAERVLTIGGARAAFPMLPAQELRYERQLPKAWGGVADAARRRGQGLTVLPLADGADWLLVRRGTAFNSFSVILAPRLGTPRFSLLEGAHALRLEWSGSHRRVEAVIYRDRASGQDVRLECGGVVVAAGALRSTKLLFDSACPDFPDGIGNTEGLLGRFFHDHLKEWWSFQIDDKLSRLTPAAYLTRRPYDDAPPLMATSWTIGNASNRAKVLALTPLPTSRFGVQVFGTMVPTADRLVRPHAALCDEFGLPQLELAIHFDADEVANVVAARQHLMELLADAGHHGTVDPVEPQLMPGVAVHYGGTARMHRSREHGVVDAWNRPFDVPNVVVADAACFTTNSEKNPTLTAMALAARAADRLAADLKAG